MKELKSTDYILILMKNLNGYILLYLAFIIAFSFQGYLKNQNALELLTSMPIVPIAGIKIPMLVVCFYVSLLAIMHITNATVSGLICKVFLEIGIAFYISYLLGFSYTGTILIILADTMKYFQKAKWKYPFAFLVCFVYIMADYELLSLCFRIVPLNTYMEYYGGNVRAILNAIKNMSISLNTFVFFIYIILLVRNESGEKEKILELSQKQNEINAQLKEANQQLEQYAKEAVQMVETRERNRLAREIHDTIGHALTGIITGLEACVAIFDVSPDTVKVQLGAIIEVARQGMTDVRRSVKALRPDALEKLNLSSALTNIVQEMQNATGTKIQYLCSAQLEGFKEDEEEIIYRIVQESITNAIRHGRATYIEIDIASEYGMLEINIKDNEIGCAEITPGFGLYHMEERIRMLRGNLSYGGEDGFWIRAQIPIRWGSEEK